MMRLACSNSVSEEVANEVAVEIAYFMKRFILFLLSAVNLGKQG